MIDTIVFLISKNNFTITQPDNFSPSAQWVLNNNFDQTRSLQSRLFPSKKERKNGIYKPRLTLSNRMNIDRILDTVLKIELSLPKLLFLNNFKELQYKDFNILTCKLHHILSDMGVKISIHALK